MLLRYLITLYFGFIIEPAVSDCPPGSILDWDIQSQSERCLQCKPGTYQLYSNCRNCLPGTYSHSGATSCMPCKPGTYQLYWGKSSCSLCGIGHFQPEERASSCQQCRDYLTTVEIGSKFQSDCIPACSPGLYYNRNNQCVQCEPGKYQSLTGKRDCNECPEGTYSQSRTTSCTPCEPGTYQPTRGQSSCLPCPVGTYQPDEGQFSCYPCELGKPTVRVGSKSHNDCITTCSPGSYYNRNNQCVQCEPGKYQSLTEKRDCDECPEGTYSQSRATSCTPCEPGTYQPTRGQSSCLTCPIGTYQPDEGQFSCYPCELGKTTIGVGSKFRNDCITILPCIRQDTCDSKECSAGTFRLNQSLTCEKCPIGSYQPKPDQTSCISCDAGTYQNQTSQTSCMQCLSGSYQSSNGSESCIKCSAGFYQPYTGSSNQCLACPVGTYQDSPGAVSCNKCIVGTFQNQTGQINCNPCPIGSYQSSEGTIQCIDCPPGMYQNITAQSQCLNCPPGSYKDEPGPGLCTECDLGMYQNVSGQTSCSTCPNGTKTTGIGTKSIQECISSGNTARTGADSEGNNTDNGVIAGGVGGAIAFLLVVAIVIFITVRQYRLKEANSHETSRQDNILTPPNNSYLEISIQQQKGEVVYTNLVHEEESKEKCKIAASVEFASKDNTYYNMEEYGLLPRGAVMLSNLWDYVQENTIDGSKLSEEFEALPSGLLSPAKAAIKAGNCQNNRYKGLYPYDSTRVQLLPLGEEKSDYINASFIDGYSRPKTYIASQGTTKFNINDFWRMIYQQDVQKIVMLTRLVEDDTMKCLQYWPDEGSQQQYGGIKVTLVHVDTFAEYDIRTLAMTVENTTKQVTQFHFTAWPDKGVPEAASSIVQFWHKVRNLQSHSLSPTVVHCSAGIGRTGTYIALDYLVEQGKDKKYVHIFPCVAQLRRQRVNLVQTEDQYRFLHEALAEALMVSGSAVSAEKFPAVYKELLEIDRKQRKTGLLLEFEKLQTESNRAIYLLQEVNDMDGEDEENEANKESSTHNHQYTSKLEVNKHKNRYSNVLPADTFRPCLSLVEGRTDYINAVKLQSHRQKDGLIVTQMPMEDTVIDFWRLVYDFGIRTIVMLNVLPRNNKGVGIYWPSKGESMTEMFFNIENVDESRDNKDYLCRTIRLTKDSEQPREVRQFQCKFWHELENVPLQTDAMLKLIDGVEQWQRQAEIKTVVVHCMDGAERSGLYCVLTTVLERLNVERDVAIYQTVKKMRTRRQQIIPNFEQYKYCHNAVLEYLSNFGTYSNFSEI